MTKILCSLMFLIGIQVFGQHSRDMAGSWQWVSQDGNTNLELILEYDSPRNIKGKYCASFERGEIRDCRKDENQYTINLIRIAENIFDGTIESRLNSVPARLRLQYNPLQQNLRFKITQKPPGEYLFPREAFFIR